MVVEVHPNRDAKKRLISGMAITYLVLHCQIFLITDYIMGGAS
jgi:hypothetical protein